jgi:hypothetical protein
VSPVAVDPVVGLALRGALSVLFASAASHTLRHRRAFRAAVANYQLLPAAAVPLAAAALVGAEVSVAVGLWVPQTAEAAAMAAAALLALYAGAIAVNLVRGRPDIDCGCAGPARRQSLGAGLVARNGVLAAAALLGALRTTGRPLIWLDALTVAAAMAAMALLYAAADELLAHAWRAPWDRARRATSDTRHATPEVRHA